MNPYATFAAPALGDVASRGSGLMGLLAPLDYPRQAIANLGQKIFAPRSDESPLDALLGAAPALIGGIGGLATGNPLIGALLAGAFQGAGNAGGYSAFNAPTAQDTAEAMGMGDSTLGSMFAGAITDPLSYVGLPGAIRGAGAAGLAERAAVPAALGGVEAAAGAGGREAADLALSRLGQANQLGEAQQTFGRALGNVDEFAAQQFPRGELGHGPVPNYNQIPEYFHGPVTDKFGNQFNQFLPDPNFQPASLSELLAQSADPRTPFLQYTPEVGANLGGLGEFNSLRTSQANAPEVMRYLENRGQNLLGPAPNGVVTFPGPRPEGLAGSVGGWTTPQMHLAPAVPPPVFEMGQLPPDLLRPREMPSLEGLARGLEPHPTSGYFPRPFVPNGLAGVGHGETDALRQMLAGVGGGVNPVDMPLDLAHAMLGRESAAARSQLLQALQALPVPPDQQQKLIQMLMR